MRTDIPFFFILILVQILLVGLIIVGVWVTLRRQQNLTENWRALAHRHGLTFTPNLLTLPDIMGVYCGYPLQITGSYGGRHRSAHTTFRLTLPQALPVKLAITEQGLGAQLEKMLGAQEVQIGEEAVDRRFMLQGQPPTVIPQLFASLAFRQKLLQARKVDLRVEKGQVRYRLPYVETDLEQLQLMLELLRQVAEVVERVA